MLSYSAHNLKNVLVKGDKKKFASLLKQVEGRWNTKQDGWLIPIENEKKLTNLINALYPEQVTKEETIVHVEFKEEEPKINTSAKAEEPKINTSAKAESADAKHKETSKANRDETRSSRDSRRYRRSRSPSSSSSSSSSSGDDQSSSRTREKKQPEHIDQYYKSFKKSPRSFSSSNLYDDEHIHLSSSSSSDYDSSSPDFPNPSPKRNRHITDDVFDKMEAVRRRLRQIEKEEKDKDKKRR